MPQISPGSDLVLLSASIAIAISDGLSVLEIEILSSMFSAIGDNLAIIASKKEVQSGSRGSASS